VIDSITNKRYYVISPITILRGGADMEGVKINQVRWPVELYEWIRERAHERRQSINRTVIELAERVREEAEA